MKILIVMGSPRKGDSYEVTQLIEKKINSLGKADFEYLWLKDAHLELCKGCCVCFLKGEQCCPLKDDREKIERAMQSADGVIFVSPVYVMGVTALMKNFIDRFAYRCHRPYYFDKYAMLVSNAAFIGTAQTMEALGWAARTWGFNVVNKLGVRSFPFSSETMRKRTEERIASSAEKFYFALRDRKKSSPSLFSLVGFKAQKAAFARADRNNADFRYWDEKGWLKREAYYYVPVRVGLFKRMTASLIFKAAQSVGIFG